jgi:tetratricopeptide (TPR) repeat protein
LPGLLLLAALIAAAPAAAPAAASVASAATPARASARAYAQYLRGRQAEQRSDWRVALEAYRAAVEADPAAPSLRVSLAEAWARTGNLPRAEAEARKAIELDPRGPAAAEAWAILGKTATVGGRVADAEADLRQAIDILVALSASRPPGQAPLDPDPWRVLAQVKLDAGDVAGATAVLEDLASRLPAEGAISLRELGRIRAERGDLDGAAALYRKAVAAERRDTEAWQRLAELEESRRHFDDARRAWEGLVRQDSDDPEALLALGRLSLRAGDVPGARAFFDQSIHVSPSEAEARARVAYAWLDARRPADALATADEGLRWRPDPRLQYLRGLALREERRWDESAAAFAQVDSGDPEIDGAALAARASVLAQSGRSAEALSLLDAGLARNGGDVRLITARGYALEKAGRPDEAVTWLTQAIAAQPRADRLRFALGVAQERAGDRAGAIRTMESIIQAAPDNAEALNFVGYSWAEKGERLDEAERLVRRAVELEPDNGSYLDSLGWILFQKGDLPAAVSTLERAEALAGAEPTILEHLGDAYLRSGRTADAAKAWRRALQALDEGVEADLPGQRAGIEKKLRDQPGGDVRPARR